MKAVIITVVGGVAYVKQCPGDVRVLVVDYDSVDDNEGLPDITEYSAPLPFGVDEELFADIEFQNLQHRVTVSEPVPA